MSFMDDLSGCGGPVRSSAPRSATGVEGLDEADLMNTQHSWKCEDAVTAVDSYGKQLFVGTITGQILVYDLDSYTQVATIEAHKGSVLVLVVRGGYLLSGSSDSLLKVWDVQRNASVHELHSRDDVPPEVPVHHPILKYTVYSVFDIGDIFSIEFIPEISMLYFGTQNAAVSWCSLNCTENSARLLSAPEISRERRSSHHHPAVRPNKFFDSAGPGGRLAPPQHATQQLISHINSDSTLIEVPAANCINFAHNGYVYSMLSAPIWQGHHQHGEGARVLVSGGGDSVINIWSIDAPSGRIVKIHSIQVDSPVLSMSLANSWQLYCGLGSGKTLALDLDTWQTLTYVVEPGAQLLTVTAVNDVLVATSGHRVIVYDPSTSSTHSWDTPSEITACNVVAHKKNHVVTVSQDGTITLWRIGNENDATPNNAHYELLKATGANQPHKEDFGTDTMISVLANFVQFQTVSGRDSQHWAENRSCASAVRGLLRQYGAESELWKVEDGNPIVFGKFKANKANTDPATKPASVLFYGHYDVIEANEYWETPPFQLNARNGYMYARGVSDNKGPCLAAIFAVAELYANEQLTNDVVFLIEGEEESGSFRFLETVEEHRAKIGYIDWILFSNSYWLNDTQPCLNYGLRGVIYCQIKIQSDKTDAHSGVDGGLFREPAIDLVNLLSRLVKPTGEIDIPHFADNVLPVTEHEDSLYEAINTATADANPQDSAKFSKEELMRRWRYPSLTVHKMEVSGPGNSTVIPASVTASISIRIVPDQTTEEIKKKLHDFLDHKFAELSSPNRLSVEFRYAADPWLGDPQNEAFQILRDAVRREWGVEPLFVREGGTIPMARALEKLFEAPAAQFPVGQSSDNAHLNNERLRITNFVGAKRIFSQAFTALKTRRV